MERVCLVHLVWAPLGSEPVRAFAEAYRRHPPGCPHRLLVVLNGFGAGDDLGPTRAALDGLAYDELRLAAPEQDLGAYREALRDGDEPVIAFANSFAEPLVDGWLGMLRDALTLPDAGMAGATGSYESAATSAPRHLRPLRARAFPAFPNPHLRTNGLALRRELALELDWPRPRTKLAALRLESGKRGLSAQVRDRGRRLLVVGADGRADDIPAWPGARTFRSGDQERLLIADNRTRDYAAADAAERARLAAMAWGPDAAQAPETISA